MTINHIRVRLVTPCDSHDDVKCPTCDKIVSGPHRASGAPVGKGYWLRECTRCSLSGIVVQYDVVGDQ